MDFGWSKEQEELKKQAIEFAQKTNMTLAGFVRPPYMTIYTGSHRIRFESSS